jgi:hypothetical protein
MANEIELLDPEQAVESIAKIAAERLLNRRNFMAALGVTGAAGAALSAVAGPERPSVVQASGPTQTDVLNFALNLEYLEATFYSYITQGTDLPGSLTTGSGAITNAPTAKLAFTGSNAAQITDLLNEIYYDELSHVTTLRSLLGPAAVARPAINLAPYAVSLSAFTAPGIARLLEDVGVTAYTGAAALLSGANLTYAAQILAVEGFHSGALRLIGIQNPTSIAFTTTGSSTVTATSASGSNTLTAVYYNTATPAVGQAIAGPGIPGATITGLTGYPLLASLTLGSTIVTGITTVANVASVAGLVVGQTVTGAGIPSGTTIIAINAATFSISISNAATATTTTATIYAITNAPVTGTTNKTTTITGITPTPAQLGITAGMFITGSGIPANTYITAVSGTTITISAAATAATSNQALAIGVGTITMSANATQTFANDIYFGGADALDLTTTDLGATLEASGPTLAGGFFTTSGGSSTNNNSPVVTPAGLAFTRSTSQVLSIVYGSGSTFAVSGTTKGGFFPSGMNGVINTV